MSNLLVDIGIVFIVAAFFALLVRAIKQPYIIGYILAGIVIGPIGLGWISDYDSIITLSELGIVFLLFIVGLELDIRKVKHLGFVAFVTGIGQIIFTFLITMIFLNSLGFELIQVLFLSLAFTLSSTIVVIKLYSDRNEMNTLHARIALGILIVQDFVAVLALTLISSVNQISAPVILGALFKSLGIFSFAILMGTFALKPLFRKVASSRELLTLFAVAWLFVMVLISYKLDFSIAIGAFLAGVSMAALPFTTEIVAKTTSLRDFFATIFFVALGMQVLIPTNWTIPIVLSLFVLIGNSFIILVLMSFLGFKSRVAFTTGLGLAQISEFSLILGALGLELGIIDKELMSIIALVAVITFIGSSYMVTQEKVLYRILRKPLKLFEKLSRKKLEFGFKPDKFTEEAILFGGNRIGHSVLMEFKKLKLEFLVVDFNPELIRRLTAQKVPCLYGDGGDPEILAKLNFKKAKLVVSTITGINENLLILKKVRSKRKRTTVIVTATDIEDALILYKAGAQYVILPHFLGGERLSLLVRETHKDLKRLIDVKSAHLKELKERQKLGHEHPKKY